MPVEEKHCRSWLIPITINQTSTLALLDTGANCTMIGRPLYETLHAIKPLKLKTNEDPLAHVQERAGVPVDDHVISGPPRLEATIGNPTPNGDFGGE